MSIRKEAPKFSIKNQEAGESIGSKDMDALSKLIASQTQKYAQSAAQQSGYMAIGKSDPQAEKFADYMEQDIKDDKIAAASSAKSEPSKSEPVRSDVTDRKNNSVQTEVKDQYQTQTGEDAGSGDIEAGETANKSEEVVTQEQKTQEVIEQNQGLALGVSAALLNLTQAEGSQVPLEQSQAIAKLQQGADLLTVNVANGVGAELATSGASADLSTESVLAASVITNAQSGAATSEANGVSIENGGSADLLAKLDALKNDSSLKADTGKADTSASDGKSAEPVKTEQKAATTTETLNPDGTVQDGEAKAEGQAVPKETVDPAKLQKPNLLKDKGPDLQRFDQNALIQNTQNLSANASAKPIAGIAGQQIAEIPAAALAAQIATQAQNGNKRFDIRLDPPELGRIDVRLDMHKDGTVHTHIAVEKSETLDLMQRDSRQLERALHNAGLDTKGGSLSFSLKDQGFSGQDHNQNERRSSSPRRSVEIEDQAIPTHVINSYRPIGYKAGLDIRI